MQAQYIIGGNFCLSKAGITGLSGAATTFTTANAITYAITGKALSKAAVAGGATPTTDSVTGAAMTLKAGFGTVLVWALDASGNIKIVQGTTEALDSNGNTFINAVPQFPNLPDTLVPFAYSVHKNAASNGSLFTFGTSNWNQTGITHSANDVIALPNRPQIS